MLAHFLFGTTSTMSIFLASITLFVTSATRIRWKRLRVPARTISLILMMIFLTGVLYLRGRAGWIGLLTGFLFIGTGTKCTMVKKITLVFLPLLFTFCLLFIKKDSSLGRVLIYKISTNIFHDHWLWGTGFSEFKNQYNLYQANYFLTHNINGKEALLADNTFYAFNDPWQLLIEIGTVRFIILLALVVTIYLKLRPTPIDCKKTVLFEGGCAGLLCILTASFFSNPFHFAGLQLISVCYILAILFSLSPATSISKRSIAAGKTIVLGGLVLVSIYHYKSYQLIQNSKQAFDLSRAGYTLEALTNYSRLLHSSQKYGPSPLHHAQILYNTNRLQEGRQMIREAKKFYAHHEVYKLSALIEFELGNFNQAEKDYQTAVYMVPNRMKTRFELFKFYLDKGDTTKARLWGTSILTMPVKVPSPVADKLKMQTQFLLKQLPG